MKCSDSALFCFYCQAKLPWNEAVTQNLGPYAGEQGILLSKFIYSLIRSGILRHKKKYEDFKMYANVPPINIWYKKPRIKASLYFKAD